MAITQIIKIMWLLNINEYNFGPFFFCDDCICIFPEVFVHISNLITKYKLLFHLKISENC